MSIDLYLAPPSGFRDWTEGDLDAFFEREPNPENVELGRIMYVALALEAISHNLADDAAGVKFPVFMRIDALDEGGIIGWYHDEVPALLAEVDAIRVGLAGLPVCRTTLHYDNDDDVNRRIAEFRQHHPGHRLDNLYDLYHHFVDVIDRIARRALATGSGLLVA